MEFLKNLKGGMANKMAGMLSSLLPDGMDPSNPDTMKILTEQLVEDQMTPQMIAWLEENKKTLLLDGETEIVFMTYLKDGALYSSAIAITQDPQTGGPVLKRPLTVAFPYKSLVSGRFMKNDKPAAETEVKQIPDGNDETKN